MPIYEYYCIDCRETFSALRPMAKADDMIECSACGSLQTQRMLSLFAVHTTGDGSSRITAGGGCGCGGGGCGCGGH